MNYKESCKILKITPPYTNDELKKQYRKLLLKYHPDKSGSDTNEKFIQVQNAYLYLQNNPNNSKDYTINNFFEKSNEYFLNFIENLNQDTLLNLYTLSIKNKYYVNNYIINALYNEIKTRKVFQLNVTLNNLFNNDIYILDYANDKYYIPLWHNELVYSNRLKVICNPILPPHVKIDKNNNILLYINLTNNKINKKITFNLGSKEFSFFLTENILKTNEYIFENKGISLIDEIDIYNVSKKSNIICKIICK